MISKSTLKQFNRDFLTLITSHYVQKKIVLIDSSLEEKGFTLRKNYKNTFKANTDQINYFTSFFKERFISFNLKFAPVDSSQNLIYDGLEISFNYRIITFKNGEIVEKPSIKPTPYSSDYEYHKTVDDFDTFTKHTKNYKNWAHPRWAWILKNLTKRIEEFFKLKWPESGYLTGLLQGIRRHRNPFMDHIYGDLYADFSSDRQSLPEIINAYLYEKTKEIDDDPNSLKLPPKVLAELIRRKDRPFQIEEFDYEKYTKRLGYPGMLIFNREEMENYELSRKKVDFKKLTKPRGKRPFLEELARFPVKPESVASASEFLDKCRAKDIFIDPEFPAAIEEIEKYLPLGWPESFRQLGILNYIELFSKARAIILTQRPLLAISEVGENEIKTDKGILNQKIGKIRLLPVGTGLPAYKRPGWKKMEKKENNLKQQFKKLINSLYYQHHFVRTKRLQPDDLALDPKEFLVALPSIIIREKSLERAFLKVPDMVEQIIFDILEGDVLKTTSGLLVSACCSHLEEAVDFLEIIGLRHLRDFFKFDAKKKETYKFLFKRDGIIIGQMFSDNYCPDSLFFDYVKCWKKVPIYYLESIAKKFKLFNQNEAFILKLKTGIEEILDDDKEFDQFMTLKIKQERRK